MPRVVVIGAGPAGSIAAICLARAGIDTLLIEQHRFPRDKVCGECLSALGIEVLHRLHLADRVLSLQPAILHRAFIHTTDGESAKFNLPSPMWGISRHTFDSVLLDAARTAGARILQPARCEATSPDVRVRSLDTNQIETINADYIVLADGKGERSDDLGFKAHFRQVDSPADAIELFGVTGHYGGIAPIEQGLWNVAFSVPAARFKRHGQDLDGLFSAMVSENPVVATRMKRAQRVSDWLVSPLPRSEVARQWPRQIIPVGNSAAAIEPIGGEGMGLAMRSAELAAAAIVEAIRNSTSVNTTQLRSEYHKLWNLRSLLCRVGGRIISSPSLSRLMVPLAARADGPVRLALKLVGK